MIKIKNIRSDYLYLIWKNPQTRSRHLIGTLKKNEKYEFQYSQDIKKCQEKGFDLLVSFPDINKKYVSENLFPEFLSRIPGPNRIDIKDILEKYKLESYNAFELLKSKDITRYFGVYRSDLKFERKKYNKRILYCWYKILLYKR